MLFLHSVFMVYIIYTYEQALKTDNLIEEQNKHKDKENQDTVLPLRGSWSHSYIHYHSNPHGGIDE